MYKDYFSSYAYLQKLIPLYQAYCKIDASYTEALAFQKDPDPDIQLLAQQELSDLETRRQQALARIESFLTVEDPLNTKNAIMEIQAGVGGDESALFVEILFRMYGKYAQKQGWEVEIDDVSYGNQGGFKSIAFSVKGKGAYGAFRFESGSHKIQRVSPTDSAKRVHTSAATVVVLPEIEIKDYAINKADVRVDSFCSGGPGGQNVNKVTSGVRLVHEPTKIMVRVEGRSRHINLERAWQILTSRIADFHRKQVEEKQERDRQILRGDGSRGGCIRTYNFPQNRITDHRASYTAHNLDDVLIGDLDDLIANLRKPS